MVLPPLQGKRNDARILNADAALVRLFPLPQKSPSLSDWLHSAAHVPVWNRKLFTKNGPIHRKMRMKPSHRGLTTLRRMACSGLRAKAPGGNLLLTVVSVRAKSVPLIFRCPQARFVPRERFGFSFHSVTFSQGWQGLRSRKLASAPSVSSQDEEKGIDLQWKTPVQPRKGHRSPNA